MNHRTIKIIKIIVSIIHLRYKLNVNFLKLISKKLHYTENVNKKSQMQTRQYQE